MADALFDARAFVAAFYEGLQRQDLAAMVRGGEGDDFPEVTLAKVMLQERSVRLAHMEDALRQYADPDFWDDDAPGGSLAAHDRGEMAANVLLGKPAFFHRD